MLHVKNRVSSRLSLKNGAAAPIRGPGSVLDFRKRVIIVTDSSERGEEVELCPIFLKLPAEHIVFLMFILESYEDLGVVRTLSAARGEIVILSVPDSVEHCRAVIADLGKTIAVREIPRPDSVSGDWLLSDMESSQS
jgi:hypothetical protein